MKKKNVLIMFAENGWLLTTGSWSYDQALQLYSAILQFYDSKHLNFLIALLYLLGFDDKIEGVSAIAKSI